MLYEMIGIVRPGNVAEVKEIVTQAGQLILRQRGVIRGISNWGIFTLPKPTTKHQMRHHHGHYFALRFDGSIGTQEAVHRLLYLDPRMIRHSSVKLGDGKLEGSSHYAAVDWSS